MSASVTQKILLLIAVLKFSTRPSTLCKVDLYRWFSPRNFAEFCGTVLENDCLYNLRQNIEGKSMNSSKIGF